MILSYEKKIYIVHKYKKLNINVKNTKKYICKLKTNLKVKKKIVNG